MTVFDALERTAEFGFDPFGPAGVQGLGIFLAGVLDFFDAGFSPFRGLGGGDFDEDALGFVAQAGANIVEEHCGFVANRGDGCVRDHFFHLLLEIAHQVADGTLRGGGTRLRGESVRRRSDFGGSRFGRGGDGQLRMQNRDVLQLHGFGAAFALAVELQPIFWRRRDLPDILRIFEFNRGV